jgi:predicted heme/steroid binding protein
MRRFTKEELSRYNGEGGGSSYVAFRGKVYDVTGSFLWRDGRHFAVHAAGADLTAGLDQAPHGPELLEGIPVVGELEED